MSNPVGIAMLALGAVLFFGSWFVGNTVDSPASRAGEHKMVMLQKDAITFFLRVIGAFIAIAGLLTWVLGGGKHISL